MALHDGNGWVECRCGQRHWGRHGAAGLLLARPVGGAAAGAPGHRRAAPARYEVLLQLRAGWTHQGGSWALPGGARDSHEDVIAAALREAREETGVERADLVVVGQHPGVEHGDWSYSYVIALARNSLDVVTITPESAELRWLRPEDVAGLELLPAFRSAWPTLHTALATALRVPGAAAP